MRVSEGVRSRRVAAVVVWVLGAMASVVWALTQNAPSPAQAGFVAILIVTALAAEILAVDLHGGESAISFALPYAATLAVIWSPVASLFLMAVAACASVFPLKTRRARLLPARLTLIAIATGIGTVGLVAFRRFAPGADATPFAAIVFLTCYAGAAYAGEWLRVAGPVRARPGIPVTGLGVATVALFGAISLVVAVASQDKLPSLPPLTLIPVWALTCGLRTRTRMSDSYYETVTALTMMLQRAHPYTHEHVDRVARAAEQVARRLGLPSERARLVRAAAVLHDIGKIAVDEAILDKPGALSESERRHVENHPVWGAQILAPVRQFHDLLPWIRHHHERPDGGGYPDGLSDVEIPIESKIIAVVDAYDAMTDAGRRYRSPLSPYEAIEELRRCSGTQFDSAVVEVFGEMVTQRAG